MKIVNFVLGLAAAVIFSALIGLGIAAFYPAPVAPSYQNTPSATLMPCASGDAACQTANTKAGQANQAQQQQFNNAEAAYTDQIKIYNRDLFIIANIVGVIVFAAGFWLVLAGALASNAVPVGIMLAGLWSIMYGYARGWGSIGDQLKFFIGLVIAVIVIGGNMWLMQRYQKKHAQS